MIGLLVAARCSAAALALLAMGGCNRSVPVEAAATSVPQAAVPRPSARPPLGPVAPSQPARPADFLMDAQLIQGGWVRGVAPAGTASLTIAGANLSLAPDGTFFAAFDRDAGPAAKLVARLADGRTVSRDLVIAPRGWNIEHVAVGPRPGAMPSAEYQRRRAGEIAQINAARAQSSDAQGWRQRFIWPVRGRLSGLFGSQRIYRGQPGSYHSGTDVAGPTGTVYVAPADGVVILAAASPFTLEGNLLMIDHGMGLNSAFLHSSELLVRAGDRVRQGQPVGRIGMTGRATGPHLHWGMKWRSFRVDPMLFAGPMQ